MSFSTIAAASRRSYGGGGVSQPPLAVTFLRKDTSASGQLKVLWDRSPAATSYSLRLWHYDASWNIIEDGTFTTTDLTYTFTGLSNSLQYSVEVTAVNSFGNSPMVSWYGVAGTMKAPELKILAYDPDAKTATLSWSGGVATSFEIIEVIADNHTVLQTVSTGTGILSLTGLTGAGGYGYYIIAKSGSLSDWSNGVGVHFRNFYVSSTGSDTNTGLTTASPWKTIDKVNTELASGTLGGGVVINFNGGETFAGNLVLKDDYTTVRSYGTGKAIINGGTGNGIYAENLQGTKINNITVMSPSVSANNGHGIWAMSTRDHNFKQEMLEIKDCLVYGFKDRGILFEGNNVSTGFRNVLIQNTVVRDCMRGGIASMGGWSATKTTYAHDKVLVTGCEVYNITGNSAITDTHTGNPICLGDVNDGKIALCTAHDSAQNNNSSAGGAVGIWFWDSNLVTIEMCESYNMSSGLTNKDGGGFDLDGGVTNGTMQYNYAHNNDGAGFLIGQFTGARPMSNITVRFNISANDAKKYSSSLFLFSGSAQMTGIQLYNNTVYQANTSRSVFSVLTYSGGSINNVRVQNNLLWGAGTIPAGYTQSNNWRVAQGDPLLVNPSAGTADGFKLQGGSPLIDAGSATGITLGSRDYYGEAVPQGSAVNIGAHEGVAAGSSNWAQDAVDAHETRVLADGGIVEDKAALLTYLQS